MGALEQVVEQAINKQVAKRQLNQILVGVAKNVTESTCDIERAGAPMLTGVRLNAIDDNLESYCTIIPKENTNVIIGIIEGLKTEAVVLRCSEVEKIIVKTEENIEIDCGGKIIFNQGENGMVKIDDLIKCINRLEDKLKNHQHGYVPYPSGAPGTPVSTTPAIGLLPPNNELTFNNTQQSDIENDKILTH